MDSNGPAQTVATRWVGVRVQHGTALPASTCMNTAPVGSTTERLARRLAAWAGGERPRPQAVWQGPRGLVHLVAFVVVRGAVPARRDETTNRRGGVEPFPRPHACGLSHRCTGPAWVWGGQAHAVVNTHPSVQPLQSNRRPVCGQHVRAERGSKVARASFLRVEQDSQAAGWQGSTCVWRQGNKAARQQGSKVARACGAGPSTPRPTTPRVPDYG